MKKILLFLFAASCLQARAEAKHQKTVKKPPVKHYEMKQYYFVMLIKGKNRDEVTDTNELNKIQAGHMANIQRMADMGQAGGGRPIRGRE
ncbi:MAG: hypothetical protein JSS82_06225 [Bacteroidetes bacterium]|nr:hypothetical protein [Bacteroidota bacterium]